jgi:hypothetical protein
MSGWLERLNGLSGRQQVGLAVALALAVVAGFNLAAVPIRKWFVTTEGEIKVESRQLARNRKILEPVLTEAVEKAYREMEAVLKKKGSTAEETAAMFGTLDTLAREARVTLAGVKPQETQNGVEGETYRVDLEIEADMPGLLKFLHGVESSPQVLRVDQLQIQPVTRPDAPPLKGQMTISKLVFL